jgi:hypothetical protein
MIVYPSSAGASPDQEFLESQATTMESRLVDPPSPGVGFSIARMDPATVVTYDDAYYRSQSRDLPMTEESKVAEGQRIATYADAADVYQLFQDVTSESGNSVLYSLTVYKFPTEGNATAWMNASKGIIQENTYYGVLTQTDFPIDIGDQLEAFRFESSPGNENALIVLVRTGSVVHRVQLVPTDGVGTVPLTIGADLTETQIECFETGTCFAVPIPNSLLEFLDAPAASPAATPDA